MLKRLALSCAAFALLGVAPLRPAHAQWAVIDGASIAQEIQERVNQIRQIANQTTQIQQQIQQYEQMVNNAKALGGLGSLLAAYKISPSQLSTSQILGLLSKAYTLSSTDPNWDGNLQSILTSTGYSPPATTADITNTAANTFDPNYAPKFVNGYNKYVRDYTDYSQTAKDMADAKNSIDKDSDNLASQQDANATVGDNSEVATLQNIMLALQIIGQTSVDHARLDQISAHALMQQNLKQTSDEVDAANNEIKWNNNIKTYLTAPVPDKPGNPITHE